MKIVRKTQLSLSGAALIALSLGLQADDSIAPDVMFIGSTLVISAPTTMNVAELSLEIVGPDDEMSVITKLDQSSMSWTPSSSDSNGYYRYEVSAVAEDSDGEEGEVSRTHGEFRVSDFMVIDTAAEQIQQDAADEATQAAEEANHQSALEMEDSIGIRVATAALNILVPVAKAADVTIYDATPQLNFRDNTSTCGGFFQPSCPTNFQLEANSSGNFYMQEGTSGTFFHYNSLNDIKLLNGDFYFDTSPARLGIGTTAPGHELTIRASSPGIRIDDSSSSLYDMEMELNSYSFELEGASNQDIFEMDIRAPAQTIDISNVGNVAIGGQASGSTALTTPDLLIRGDGGVGVERLVQLESTSSPQMVFRDTNVVGSSGVWFFAMTADNQFKISYDGTGEVEAKLFQNGNLNIAGALTQNSDRNDKQDILQVDSQDVLDAVASLPISTWEYKDDEGVAHMGPMAQDFYAAFGLGSTPTGIATIDTGGVALAAIKGLNTNLNELVQARDKEISSLKSDLASNKLDISELRELILAMGAKEEVVMK
jgi:hypothetical protein